jgi:hypothetical protein
MKAASDRSKRKRKRKSAEEKEETKKTKRAWQKVRSNKSQLETEARLEKNQKR